MSIADLPNAQVPILGFAAYSGTGKTTLLTQLLAHFQAQGWRIGMVKHAHHRFDVDTPGKDSYELRKAGAVKMLIASQRRWALMVETPELAQEPSLNDLLGQMDQSDLDFVLVEGMKKVPFPKIELHRPSLGKPLLYPQDSHIIAIASDAELNPTPPIPQLDLNQLEQIADFCLHYLGLTKTS